MTIEQEQNTMSNYSIWPSDGSITLDQAINMLRKKQAQMPREDAVALDAKVMWGLHDFSKESEDKLVNSIMEALVIAPPPIKNSVKVGFPHYWKWWCEEVYENLDWSGFSDTISIMQMKRFIECT